MLPFAQVTHVACLTQIGDESPDVNIGALGAAFAVTQRLLEERRISAGHDISDGGIAVALLEMAFAGNTGITADVAAAADRGGPLAALFAEELGLLLEVSPIPVCDLRTLHDFSRPAHCFQRRLVTCSRSGEYGLIRLLAIH